MKKKAIILIVFTLIVFIGYFLCKTDYFASAEYPPQISDALIVGGKAYGVHIAEANPPMSVAHLDFDFSPFAVVINSTDDQQSFLEREGILYSDGYREVEICNLLQYTAKDFVNMSAIVIFWVDSRVGTECFSLNDVVIRDGNMYVTLLESHTGAGDSAYGAYCAIIEVPKTGISDDCIIISIDHL